MLKLKSGWQAVEHCKCQRHLHNSVPSIHVGIREAISQGTLRLHEAPGHKAPTWQNCDLTHILVIAGIEKPCCGTQNPTSSGKG